MDENQKRKLQSQAREFPETMELLSLVRTGLAEKLFQTGVLDRDAREALFVQVQALDALRSKMGELIQAAQDQAAIEKADAEYQASVAGQAKD